MRTPTKTITENGTIRTCTHCGERMEFDSSAAGRNIVCPHCGMDPGPFIPKPKATPKPVVYAAKKKNQGLLALGFAIQVAGILCMFIKYPLGIIPGLILLVVGGRMAIKLICSNCGNYVPKDAKLCASCGAKFKGS
jgi:RNA polymerase subunit RPABC4/transcription elongation factor Spt4